MTDRSITFGLLIVLSLMFAGQTRSSSTVILLNVNQAEVAWADPDLSGKLERRLTTELGLEVLSAGENSGLPPAPQDCCHTDSLVNWGLEAGARYLLLIDISSERLERKKTFNLPLIFHKYETVGVILGEIRIYDVLRHRLLMSQPIEFEMEAKRVFQGAMDGDRNDPAIRLNAIQKINFISKLEEKLAERLTDRVRKALKKS